MKYISFSSVYMLSWYFSWFVHSAWEGENKRGNFSCLQLPFYCKNLKRIKNANQFISFLFSFLSVSSVSVCFFFFTEGRLRDHDRVLLSYNMQLRPQQSTNCELFCSSSVVSRCRWRDTQLIRKFIPGIKKSVCTWHTELSLCLSVKF